MTTMLMRERPAPEWSHLRLCAWIVAMLDVAPRNGFARAATELYGGGQSAAQAAMCGVRGRTLGHDASEGEPMTAEAAPRWSASDARLGWCDVCGVRAAVMVIWRADTDYLGICDSCSPAKESG